ncbi:MAG: sugar transferase [Thermomicrobiales bacterium]
MVSSTLRDAVRGRRARGALVDDRGRKGRAVQRIPTIDELQSSEQPPRRKFAANRLRLIQQFARVGSDAALLWFAFWLAYTVRYTWEIGGAIQPGDWRPFSTFYLPAALLMGATLVVFLIRRAYRLPRWTSLLDEATLVIGSVTTSMAAVILFAYLLRYFPSRLALVYAWVGAILLLLLRRVVSRLLLRRLWARGIGVDRVLVVGAGGAGRRVMQALMGRSSYGYRVVGFVDDGITADAVAVATEHRVTRADRLGTTEDVGELVASRDIDEVIIALPGDAHERVLAIIDQCRQRSVTFKVVPDLLQLSLDRVDLGEVSGVPLIGLKDASIRGANYAVKRAIDIVIASIVLLTMSLPMLSIAWRIRRESPGPVLFRQQRIGRNGVPFTLLKFRCMVENADQQRAEVMTAYGEEMDPRLFKLQDDPRLTKLGRKLRRWSLDELPQFINVLRGDMSVVGPRPQLPEEVADYDDWHRQRLLVTPGLTGLWQINGRSTLTFEEMVRLDLYYAEHWSPWLDLKIVLRTAPAVVTGRGAY